MPSPSKESKVLELILESSPLKEWHFEEVVREARVTRAAANKWLERFVKEGLLTKVKKLRRFPYFTIGKNNPAFLSRKRLFLLERMHTSGLIPGLLSLPGAQAIVIFGSAARGDWYKESDIDIFILGNPQGFEKTKYERKIGRIIELHTFENRDEIRAVKTGLIYNVLNGILVKGRLQDIARVAV